MAHRPGDAHIRLPIFAFENSRWNKLRRDFVPRQCPNYFPCLHATECQPPNGQGLRAAPSESRNKPAGLWFGLGMMESTNENICLSVEQPSHIYQRLWRGFCSARRADVSGVGAKSAKLRTKCSGQCRQFWPAPQRRQAARRSSHWTQGIRLRASPPLPPAAAPLLPILATGER